MTRTTRKQVQSAIDRLNDLVKKKGSKYQYQYAARYDNRYLEVVEVVDESDRSKDKYRGVTTVCKTMRELFQRIDAIICVMLDCTD
ncbi:TPA: hypothetical protein ACX6R8_003764 [Photobacterium damselae]